MCQKTSHTLIHKYILKRIYKKLKCQRKITLKTDIRTIRDFFIFHLLTVTIGTDTRLNPNSQQDGTCATHWFR